MKILILAAGYGTRLKALGLNKSKPLLDVGGQPLINYILDKIKNLPALDQVLVVTNDKFYGDFCEWTKKLTKFPYQVVIVNDGTKTPEDRLGSIGDIDFAIKKENIKDDILVIGGDNLFDYSLDGYLKFSVSKKAVTIGLYDIGDIKQAPKFGVVAIDKNGKITSFEEKPQSPKSTLIAMCCYYLPKDSLPVVAQYLKASGKNDTAGDYIRWLSEKKDVYGFKFTGKWYDIGSVESYQEAQQIFKKGGLGK